ncbi:hypothetical protein HDF26_002082 [Pedobacter cryoconitis]|uniref:DUF3298 domain-containing protein n=1 Tax=Pedobacter cryoconitis TaxID=188932 RepID=A0A7W8ZJS7_9SPHI|nr:RsiV family protein [Pedobacter cryoconitis]MBB5635192.1 hypothetical protein [Pedobacter cryoconitis]MBB6271625.1 hypothetical protein [Pedobacter cryoconitis]
MKSSSIYLFSLAIVIAGCHSSEKKAASADSAITAVVTRKVAVQEHLPENFYKRFQGIIGDHNVVINLSKIGKNFTGTYDYNGTQVNLVTDKIVNQDSIILIEKELADHYTEDAIPASAKLHLKWTGTVFSGTKADGKENSSIRLEESYPDGSYAFKIATYADSAKVFPKKKDSPQANISYEYLMPAGHTPQEQWLDKQLKKAMDLQKPAASWTTSIKNDATAYLNAYKAEIRELAGEAGEPSATLNYNKTQNLDLHYNSNGFVIIKHLFDDYSGGAHNNYATTLYCFDVKNQKHLVLSDLIKIDSVSLQKLVEKNFRTQYKVKSGEALSTQLFEDHLAANKNFFFDTTGISFLYNPYEVASFAQGQIIVSIPYKDLKKYLNPAFAKRMEN